ncbi:tetratricopeptide repeat protein [Streptomyces scopuliridis]|uniref:tetratricopeptide repeat protein n=1 Tax=Streptomyces scopuliridis TaxID=452529 RepID=UPI0036ACABA2
MTTSNEISGSAWLSGLVVQARDVHGGLHHHAAPQQLPTPHQLPRLATHFVNRTEEINTLDEARRAGSGLVVISGLVGVGKTALAARWLSSITDAARPELYAELSGPAGPARPEDVLQPWLRAFGIDRPPAGLRELSALWRSVTAARPVSVLLDTVSDADQVPPLLPAGTSSMTVVTSRRALWELAVDGAAALSLGPLDPRSSIKLLARFTGEERIAAEPEVAAVLANRCAHLPLPLVLAGARLKSRPHRSLAAAADALVHPRREDPVRMAISAGLTETYASLGAAAQYVYRSLALLPVGAADPDMVSTACRLGRDDAERLLEVLADEQLLTLGTSYVGPGPRYQMASAVHEHALALAERHDEPEERQRLVGRLCEWMLATAAQAQLRLTPAQATLQQQDAPPPPDRVPFADDAGAMAWLESHEKNVLGVLRMAQTQGWDDIVWRLVDAYWPFFLRRHPYALWTETHEIALDSARRTGNQAAVRQMLNSGAIGLSSAGRLDQAITWYTSALEAARVGSDRRDEGQALLGLGACHYEAARPRQAEPYLHEAIALWDGCGYPRGAALATIVLGEIALTDGDPERAQGLFANARCTLLAAEDSYDAARALALYGRARALAGDPATGIGEMKAAAEVFEAAGSTRWLARVLEMLGTTHQENGDSEAARPYYQRAAELMAPIRPADAERIARLEQTL